MSGRMVYLDRLKVLLTALVVLHHLAITYGGEGGWYYYEHTESAMAANVLFTLFTVFNQSFFMGLFFFISGFFTPGSYDRKGAGLFMKQRLIRLGIPLLVFMLVFQPLLGFVSAGYSGSFLQYVQNEMPVRALQGLIEISTGPLWFVEALLIFSAGYALYRKLSGHTQQESIPLSSKLIMGYFIVVGTANFLIRLAMPVGESVFSLQLAYFPAYIALFVAGIVARRSGWLEQLKTATAKRWLIVVIFLMLLIPAAIALGSGDGGDMSVFMGGFTVQSLFYSAIDPILGFGICYVLLTLYRERKNSLTPWSSRLSTVAFTVFIIHAPIAVYISFALRGLQLYPLLKFALVAAIVLPVCVLVSLAIHKIPGANKVL